MYKVIFTAAEENSAMSVFEGTYLITEDWDIADWSASNGLLVEYLVDRLSKTLAYNMKNENGHILSLNIQEIFTLPNIS